MKNICALAKIAKLENQLAMIRATSILNGEKETNIIKKSKERKKKMNRMDLDIFQEKENDEEFLFDCVNTTYKLANTLKNNKLITEKQSELIIYLAKRALYRLEKKYK